MLGNVAEWCYDPYFLEPNPTVISKAPGIPLLSRYAGRGNQYTSIARMLRAANRNSSRYDQFSYTRGFRTAHTVRAQLPND